MCSDSSKIENIKNPHIKSIVLEDDIVLDNDQVDRLNAADELFNKYNFSATDKVTKEEVMKLVDTDIEVLEDQIKQIVRAHIYSEEYTKITEMWMPRLESAESADEEMAFRELMESELDSLKNVYY